MADAKTWVLTDLARGIYVDDWEMTPKEAGLPSDHPWSIRKRRLRGGLSDGVDIIEVDNGAFSFITCPTRGMGIWKGRYNGISLGWDSPVHGPVHPAFINRDELGGIGWLQGFDEWIVRCGLNNNGAPAIDKLLDNTGAEQSMPLPLHGRIANIPAHRVEVHVQTSPPFEISVVGYVDESMLFFPQLRLQATHRTTPGASSLTIDDRVTNLRSQPAELELLYHCNFGPPLLSQGSRLVAPVKRVAPINTHSAKALESWNVYPGPTPGAIEECFLMELCEEVKTGNTLAVLVDETSSRACVLRFSRKQLPWFTLWRNPAAESDGYVTGLEPGTDFPNAKPFERSQGRVITIPPAGSYETKLEIEVVDSKTGVQKMEEESARLQSTAIELESHPPAEWAP